MLQVPGFYEDCEDELRGLGPGICSSCVERRESGDAELGRRVWVTCRIFLVERLNPC